MKSEQIAQMKIQPGVYEDLISRGLQVELDRLASDVAVGRASIDTAELPRVLGRYASKMLTRALESLSNEDRERLAPGLVNRVIAEISKISSAVGDSDLIDGSPELLAAVSRILPDGSAARVTRPIVSLGDTTFLTNAKGEPVLLKQIESEIESATSIDVLMAFVFWAGVRPLLAPLREFVQRGGNLRLITTTYANCTEQRALDALVELGAHVKVSYDLSHNRLHAKAWLFERPRGVSTAFIGSSNLSTSAMVDGVEWNVRVAELSNADIIQKFKAVFESYWQLPDYRAYDRSEFATAVSRAAQSENLVDISPFTIEPRPFQQRLLEDVAASRAAGFHRNLVVAATGTGKTVMSAFDYEALSRQMAPARLLFVAHRKEILNQSRKMFAQIMRDPSFGELWVDGERPSKFDYVFASIQTLANQDIESIDPKFYDVIIIDEAHHMAAASYQRILSHFTPRELLGLTATPERGDGQDILQYFGDRIAAELRVWEAIEQQYLCPFAYFGIRDEVDLTAVAWRRGIGYDLEELTNVYTASHQWISLVIQQVQQKILDPSTMRALGFCVGLKHAAFVADHFNKIGIKSVVLSGGHESAERAAVIRQLAAGEIQAIFTVDIFNEGIDIPNVDTLLLLRPTDSGLLFMQQLGRGLRKARDKRVCTVLDFVGHHRKEFRYENRFRALVGGTRRELEQQIREGFPLLPAGCQIHLDGHSQAEILKSLKNAIPSQWSKMVAELKSMGDVSLSHFLRESGLTLEDLYGRNRTFAELRRAAGLDTSQPSEEELTLLRGVSRMYHIDDSTRINKYREWLGHERRPKVSDLSNFERRLARMLSSSVTSAMKMKSGDEELGLIWRHAAVRRELQYLLEVRAGVVDVVHANHTSQPDVPLRVHGLYSRVEIQAALDDLKDGKIKEFREGVRYIEDLSTDIFLFTADKSSAGFSPTTRYRDYAISSELIHWESQSTTSSNSPVGRRYINHKQNGTTILLFGRQSKSDDSYWFLGPASYVTHTGDYPIAFTWKLDFHLPAALFSLFAAAA
jgi:superfamily II DNA or RNA helicase/HKD family nuclease